ncbi:MAG: leucine-rich repeat domain-containing protein [Candidatus Heimdallarchaeota archaeon]
MKFQKYGKEIPGILEKEIDIPIIDNVKGSILKKLNYLLGMIKKENSISEYVDNLLKEIPESICDLSNLQELRLGYNEISVLPEEFGSLGNLERFCMQSNWINNVPESFSKLEKLTHLNLCKVQLNEIQEILTNLPNLKHLWIKPDWWQDKRANEEILLQLKERDCKIYT